MTQTETFYKMGFRLTYLDVFEHIEGQFSPMEIGNQGDGLYFMMYSYMAVSSEDIKAFGPKSENGEVTEEDKLKLADAMGSLLVVIGIGNGQGEKEIAKKLKMGGKIPKMFSQKLVNLKILLTTSSRFQTVMKNS